MATSVCPSCQTVVPSETVFCMACGNPIDGVDAVASGEVLTEALWRISSCPKCHAAVGVGDGFCEGCGENLARARTRAPSGFCAACGHPMSPTEDSCSNCSRHTASLSDSESGLYPEWRFGQPPPQQPRSKVSPLSWISPSGAGLVIICFFLPWLEVSCAGQYRTASAADMSRGNATFLVFPLLAALIIGAYLICRVSDRMLIAIPVILVSSGIGIFVLLKMANELFRSTTVFGVKISAATMGVEPHVGGYGTLIGFVAAAAGTIFFRMRRGP